MSATIAARRKRGQHRIRLKACGYRSYRVGGLDYLLKRSAF
jgi:maltose alpha-D-glucosyltransferase/alpha-amylase